jgi:hypothetical protein
MSNDFLSSFERDPPAKQTSVAVDNDEDEDDDLNKFQNQYPDIAPYQPVSHATPQPPQQQQQVCHHARELTSSHADSNSQQERIQRAVVWSDFQLRCTGRA